MTDEHIFFSDTISWMHLPQKFAKNSQIMGGPNTT